MRVDAFDFDLPERFVALRPARPRDSARLLHAPTSGPFEDRFVRDAPSLFRAGDVLVFNDARVIRARLRGVREREGVVRVEATLHQRLSPSRWSAFAKPGKRLKVGDRIAFGAREDRACALASLGAEMIEKREGGEIVLAFELAGAELDRAIDAAGEMPLPPYIAQRRAEDEADARDYQTIYAKSDGAVAAPTAGLHFTQDVLHALDAKGVERRFITLDVGAGTFLPVKAEDTAEHRMHEERRVIDAQTADAVNCARAEGRRVIAVGTTSLRTLESSADEAGRVRAVDAATDLFITPGYRFGVVDGLWTNFHLPRSTLFMLVSAFVGIERAHAAYAHAIAHDYRFYSYGDACLFWRS